MRISDWSSDVCSSDLNVVGLDAACWRYFGRSSQNLSWAEAALLAVLPNAPSLIHPGKNRSALKRKRDHLLDKLYDKESIDSVSWALSKHEPIPEKPRPLPRLARHLLTRMQQEGYARSEEHTSELQSIMRISYAVFCLH